MRRRLRRLAPLARPAAWSATALLAVVVGWRSPVSPYGLDRADVLVGLGQPREAVAHYDRVARYNPWTALRADALERAATVMAVSLGDVVGARVRLRELVEDEDVPAARRALAWERLGDVLVGRPEAAADAAAAYRMAWETAPTDPRAGARLIAAARATAASGDLDAAHQAWEKVARKSPDDRALARLSQAGLLLSRGRVSQARDLYREALASDPSPAIDNLARDGEQKCSERLERVSSALAEIESADLGPWLEQIRQAELEGRASDAL